MKSGVSSAIILGIIVWAGLRATPTAGDQAAGKQDPGKGFPDLVAGLKATPGCLGVETARTASGKQVIFAWFEDKKAVLKWYYSDTHQQVMKRFFPGQEYSKPLKAVPDNGGPIMAIASITFAAKPRFKETPLPISQISIELYAPLPGGLHFGGRFAPDALRVDGMRDYSREVPAEALLKVLARCAGQRLTAGSRRRRRSGAGIRR